MSVTFSAPGATPGVVSRSQTLSLAPRDYPGGGRGVGSIERVTVLRANVMRVAREYKAGEGVLCYPRLIN